MLQLRSSGFGQFLTLTYEPEEDECSYRDVQLFMKRVRRNNPEWDIQYIARGERGEKFGRFHWHMLAFGWPESFAQGVDRIWMYEWPHGHISPGEITAASSAYVYGYTEKDNAWGDTKYSLQEAVGGAGLDEIADSLSRFERYAIAPSKFSVGGADYPLDYYGKKRVEARMVANGLIEVPPLSEAHHKERVFEFLATRAQGGYDRPQQFAQAERLRQGHKERRDLDGPTQQRLLSLLPRKPRPPRP